jgi:hypothetical protein
MRKYGGNKIIILFTKLYRKIVQGGQIPEEMKLRYISSIHKKGDRRFCSNCRGICVINPIMKIFGRLIKHRLEEKHVSLKEQCGFKTGRSCIDHIFTPRKILEKCQEKSKQIGTSEFHKILKFLNHLTYFELYNKNIFYRII